MLSVVLLPLFYAALALAAPVFQNLTQDPSCASLHIIVARGTSESATLYNGMGWMHQVANMITSQINGSDSVGLVYPATGSQTCPTPSYFLSMDSGVTALTTTIINYSLLCPLSKIALIGYSQGGQVVGDTMCGTSENGFTPTKRLPRRWAKSVVAGITYGDPAFVSNQTYDRGNATVGHGIFPRTWSAKCSMFAQRYRAFCNENDMYCASGNSIPMHGSYISANGQEGADFVIQRYLNATRV